MKVVFAWPNHSILKRASSWWEVGSCWDRPQNISWRCLGLKQGGGGIAEDLPHLKLMRQGQISLGGKWAALQVGYTKRTQAFGRLVLAHRYSDQTRRCGSEAVKGRHITSMSYQGSPHSLNGNGHSNGHPSWGNGNGHPHPNPNTLPPLPRPEMRSPYAHAQNVGHTHNHNHNNNHTHAHTHNPYPTPSNQYYSPSPSHHRPQYTMTPPDLNQYGRLPPPPPPPTHSNSYHLQPPQPPQPQMFIQPSQIFQPPPPHMGQLHSISRNNNNAPPSNSMYINPAAMSSPAPAPAPEPQQDASKVLISLAEEYFDAAHELAPSASVLMTPAHVEAYQRLVATGLKCLDAALKRGKLPPRLEASVRLRYAGVLHEETDNTMEAETALTKGISLCERVCFFGNHEGYKIASDLGRTTTTISCTPCSIY